MGFLQVTESAVSIDGLIEHDTFIQGGKQESVLYMMHDHQISDAIINTSTMSLLINTDDLLPDLLPSE